MVFEQVHLPVDIYSRRRQPKKGQARQVIFASSYFHPNICNDICKIEASVVLGVSLYFKLDLTDHFDHKRSHSIIFDHRSDSSLTKNQDTHDP